MPPSDGCARPPNLPNVEINPAFKPYSPQARAHLCLVLRRRSPRPGARASTRPAAAAAMSGPRHRATSSPRAPLSPCITSNPLAPIKAKAEG